MSSPGDLPVITYLPGDEMHDGTLVPHPGEPVEVEQTWPTVVPESEEGATHDQPQ